MQSNFYKFLQLYKSNLMINFQSDYMEGAYPSIIERLASINLDKNTGYGIDNISESAKSRIREIFNVPSADVMFLVGGTQTNKLMIDALIDRCEGVIAPTTGHIAAHEAGAIEEAGHKVLAIPAENGKITADAVEKFLWSFDHDPDKAHCVAPGMVYVSFPTEYGTIYTIDELKAIHGVCKAYDIPLMIDGARLGYGLAASGITPAQFGECCDAFYIGGTKVGALFGEAMVINTRRRPKHLMSLIKRHGALLAKGWITGCMFDTLMTDNLYLTISANAIDKAMRLRDALANMGYEFALESPTNQQFILFDTNKLDALAQEVGYTFWGTHDATRSVIRLVTSWATSDAQIDELTTILAKYK